MSTPVEGELLGRNILLVEDEQMVAETIAAMLEDAGARVLGPVGTVADALAFISASDDLIDAALLDLTLHGRKVYPVADALAARGVPVVFATGYERDDLDPAYQHFPCCSKPFAQVALTAILKGVLR